MTKILIVACLCVVPILLSGCALLVPSILHPKTSVHGVVLDQYDQPVPHVTIKAEKVWPRSQAFYWSPISEWCRRADQDGRWRITARKLDLLTVEAMPPPGYKRSDTKRSEMAGPFESGECPTNTFVLRLYKLSPEELDAQQKEREKWEEIRRTVAKERAERQRRKKLRDEKEQKK